MKEAHEVIIRPIISEKSMGGTQNKRYTFEVARDANKVEIALAVEKLFSVKVKKVNTLNIKGHQKRVGAHIGFKPDWKKAVVTLTESSKGIEFFETMA